MSEARDLTVMSSGDMARRLVEECIGRSVAVIRFACRAKSDVNAAGEGTVTIEIKGTGLAHYIDLVEKAKGGKGLHEGAEGAAMSPICHGDVMRCG